MRPNTRYASQQDSQIAGFTLIEIIIVIAIISVLLSIAVISISKWRANSAVMEGAQQFARDMDRARTSAKKENACWLIQPSSLSAPTSSYVIKRYTTSSCTGSPIGTEVRTMPSGTQIAFISGEPKYVNFTPPYGTTDSAPNTYEISWTNNPKTKRQVRVTSVLGKTVIK